MRRMLFCVMLCWTFSGCASLDTLPPKRDVLTEIRVERVEVPVKVACVSTKDIPERPKMVPVDVKSADTRQLAAAVVAHVLALDSYASRAEIVMAQCATMEPKP